MTLHLVPSEQGWMSDVEVAALTGFAAIIPKSIGNVVEIGCYKGRTTSGLLHIDNVTVVDTFQGGADMDPATCEGIREAFDANMRKFPRQVTVLSGRSADVLPTLPSASARMVLVDGSHVKDDVLLDLKQAWRILAKGGVLFVDDLNWQQQGEGAEPAPVWAAVQEWCRTSGVTSMELITTKLGYVAKPE